MSLESELGPKYVHALLNGLVKKRFYGDKTITNDLLKEQIFSGVTMPEHDIHNLISNYDKLLQQAAYQNWSASHLQNHLQQQSGLSEECIAAILKLWAAENDKIHEKIVSECVWNSKLNSLSWRIDVKTNSRHSTELSQPSAIVEARIGDHSGEKRKVINFEMERDTVSMVLKEIESIESLISRHT